MRAALDTFLLRFVETVLLLHSSRTFWFLAGAYIGSALTLGLAHD